MTDSGGLPPYLGRFTPVLPEPMSGPGNVFRRVKDRVAPKAAAPPKSDRPTKTTGTRKRDRATERSAR